MSQSNFSRLSVIVVAANCVNRPQPQLLLLLLLHHESGPSERAEEKKWKKKKLKQKVNKVLISRFAFAPGKLNLIYNKANERKTQSR